MWTLNGIVSEANPMSIHRIFSSENKKNISIFFILIINFQLIYGAMITTQGY